MIIKACHKCQYHIITYYENGKEEISFCRKENCFSEFTNCIARKALERFLYQEKMKRLNQEVKQEAVSGLQKL
jgi:hypothetical protein